MSGPRQASQSSTSWAGWTNLTAWPTDYRSGNFADGIGWQFADDLVSLNTAAKEWTGLFAYWATGRMRGLMGAGCKKSTDKGIKGEPLSPEGKPGARHQAPAAR